MIIIGADHHPVFPTNCVVDTETGDCGEQRLEHSEGSGNFLSRARDPREKVRVAWKLVGLRAGSSESWGAEHRVVGGDAAVIRAKRGRKAKTDRHMHSPF
jgi:hypothetical protein